MPHQSSVTTNGVKDNKKPAAFDVTVTSPLTPATLHDACNSAGVAAHKAECRKHSSNDLKCQKLGWVCVPLAVESYWNWGKEAQNTFARLASILSISLHCPKAKVLTEIYGRLNTSLVRSVATEGNPVQKMRSRLKSVALEWNCTYSTYIVYM